MDSDRTCAAGSWFCGGAIRVVSGTARLHTARYADAFVWVVAVVWHGADSCGGGCVSFVGVALCTADPGIEPGRSFAHAAVDSGGAGRCVFGVGGTCDGDLSDFRSRFAVAERITGL